MTKLVGLALIVGAAVSSAQTTPDTSAPAVPDSGNPNTFTSLAGQFFAGDFFNATGFFNGVYDSVSQTLQSQRGGGTGYTVGGGVSASKTFSDAALSLSYRGEYRDYPSGSLGNGTNQSLNFVYSKRLGQRWTLSLSQSAGMLLYGGGYFSSLANSGGGVPTNPFSPSTRFLQSSAYLTYRQTRRLSYTFGGNFFLSRYSYAGATGTNGATFSGSAEYQLTARTKVGGTYSHDNYFYQHGAGSSLIDGGFANISHVFGRSWNVRGAVGVTRAHTQGTITLPVQIIIPGQGTIIGYQTGNYNTTKFVPTLQAGLDHRIGKYMIGASAGRGVNPGNGTFLTSTHTSAGGFVSRALGRTGSLSVNAYFSKMTSIANTIAQSYSQSYTNFSYSRIVISHVSANFSYSLNRYGSLLSYGSRNDNRFSAGLSFSTKNVPFTLF